ncbi:MAG: sulfatase-like hydrolase/transferase [Bacteroidales bacterium]
MNFLSKKILYTSALAYGCSICMAAEEKPNFLIIVCEDIGPYLNCFGDPTANTPNLDRFAKEAIRHNRMFTCVGVSAPSRYSLITGRYSSSDGANYMRSNYFNKNFCCVPPPEVKCYTELLRESGYYCTNNAKTDYQFNSPLSA